MVKRTRDSLDSPDPSTTLDHLPTSHPSSSPSYSALTAARHARSHPPPSLTTSSPPTAQSPSISPLFSIPHSTPIHALAAPPCSSHLYTGSADGFVRRYALHPTLNGTGIDNPRVVNLTSKPGGHERPPGTDMRQPVLSGYWENEEPGEWVDELFGAGGAGAAGKGGLDAVSEEKKARVRSGPKSGALGPQSAVYSLAVQRDELWGLSGTSKGSINLWTVRHDEGQIRHVLRPSAASSRQGHAPKAAVSVLALDRAETGVLSGGWDGRILQWDLNTGAPTRAYNAHPGQLSSISYRPVQPALSSSSAAGGAGGEDGDEEMGEAANGRVRTDEAAEADADADGDADGDADADADGEADADAEGEEDDDSLQPTGASASATTTASATAQTSTTPLPLKPRPDPSASLPLLGQTSPSSLPDVSDDVFLSTSLDGTVLLWDRRAKEGREGWVRKVVPGSSAGGAGGKGGKGDGRCAAACWSPSGNQFYVARRTPSIEIYDLRTTSSSSSPSSSPPGAPLHTLPLPPSTGALTALSALPTGRHLLSGSWDCVRVWDLEEAVRGREEGGKGGKGAFPRGASVVAGHHGGVVSAIHVDPTCRWMFTTSGNRGWEGSSTETLSISEVKWV